MAKFTAKDNTVSAIDQMKNSTDTYYLGDFGAPHKILILGNSITRHGPCKEIFWEKDCGMAASSIDNDYVHLLYKKLTDARIDVCFMVRQASKWETNYKDVKLEDFCLSERNFHADIVLFNLGENIGDVNGEKDEITLYNKMQELFDYLGGRVVIANCVWENKYVDECFLSFAKNNNLNFVDLSFIGKTPKKYLAIGKYAHDGVANHPGDEGMKAIATAFFSQIQNLLK